MNKGILAAGAGALLLGVVLLTQPKRPPPDEENGEEEPVTREDLQQEYGGKGVVPTVPFASGSPGGVIIPYYSDCPQDIRVSLEQSYYDDIYEYAGQLSYPEQHSLQVICGRIPFRQYYSELAHEWDMAGIPSNYQPNRETIARQFGLELSDIYPNGKF